MTDSGGRGPLAITRIGVGIITSSPSSILYILTRTSYQDAFVFSHMIVVHGLCRLNTPGHILFLFSSAVLSRWILFEPLCRFTGDVKCLQTYYFHRRAYEMSTFAILQFPPTASLRLHGTGAVAPAWLNWMGYLGRAPCKLLSSQSVQSGSWRHNERRRVSWSHKGLFINQTSEHTTK